ncbi:hypothetical protein HDU87_000807 [Geranomyces variabilis]|uniref:SHSP domain-containing protein n=1 Tax=Geranomyces variabilis TaxID=109894 RepID=A0AAD5XP99_9FUNG|nr:hypothetical protein HDU87_000807 [Geranomyces variabilis]
MLAQSSLALTAESQSNTRTHFVVRIQAPTIVQDSLAVEIQEKTVYITADVEGQAAGEVIFSNEALSLSVVLALPSPVRANEAEVAWRAGTMVLEFLKDGPPRKKVRIMQKA